MSKLLTRKELAANLLTIFAQSTDKERTVEQIAAYLVVEGRGSELDSLLRDMQDIQLDQHGVQEVDTASAHTLSDAVKRAIESLFDAEHVQLHETIDEDLIGGVRVRSKDSVMDLSVRTQLNRLKHSVKV